MVGAVCVNAVQVEKAGLVVREMDDDLLAGRKRPAIFLLSGEPEGEARSSVSATARLLVTTTSTIGGPAFLGLALGFAGAAASGAATAPAASAGGGATPGGGGARGQERAGAQSPKHPRNFAFRTHAASSNQGAIPLDAPSIATTMTLTVAEGKYRG